MDPAIPLFLMLGTIVVGTIVFAIAYTVKQNKINRDTQRLITDKELLKLIADEPDGLIGIKQLAERTGISKNEARMRISSLFNYGLLRISRDKLGKNYYSLAAPLDEREPSGLSPEPFLTVDDILQLFELYDFKLDPQKLILATGLPLSIIKREMKYFEKEGIIKILYTSMHYGSPTARQFYLNEPYRSNPQQFLQREKELNAEVEELLRNDSLL